MSGLLFHSAQTGNNAQQPAAMGLRVQSSVYGSPVPILFGKNRVPGNLIWYGAFTPIAHTTTQSAGKGGGGSSSSTSYTYTTSFALALCEGLALSLSSVWVNKSKYTSPGDAGVSSFFGGGNGQGTWAYMDSNFPTQSLNYRNVSYVGFATYDLGSNTSLPNFTFEITHNDSGTNSAGDDNPTNILTSLLTNPNYGAGIPSSMLGSFGGWASYAYAAGLMLSPVYDSQQPAADIVKQLMAITNSAVYFSEGVIKVMPYALETVTDGISHTFTPNTTPVYDLTDSDFLWEGDADPVVVTRKANADAFNQVQVEFVNRDNDYNVEIAEAKDLANIEAFGLRPMSPLKAHEIANITTARTVAQLLLQRSLYIRNTYAFKIGARFALLEPTDLVTITDTYLGMTQKLVRILTIEENADSTFSITAEDAPVAAQSAALYPSQGNDSNTSTYNVSPGSANAPVVFEAPLALVEASSGLEVWIAASGGVNWGGAQVWVSYDGNTYKQIATIAAPAREGVLSASLPVGNDPDYTNTLAVDMSMSRAQLLSGTQQDADLYNTLCYVDGELMSYETATLTSANHYALTYLRRGAYGTAIKAHASGTQFARLDSAVVKIPFTDDKVGTTIYIKLASFNAYGSNTEPLSSINAYSYNITGSALKTAAQDPTGLTSAISGNGILLKWNASTDQYWADTEIRVGSSWTGASPVTRKRSNTHTLTWLAAGTYIFRARNNNTFGNASVNEITSTLMVAAPSAPLSFASSISQDQLLASWTPPEIGANNQPIVQYIVRQGATFATASIIYQGNATSFKQAAGTSGAYSLWVSAVDAAGNEGTATSGAITITPPASMTTTRLDIQANTVAFAWNDAKTSLPIKSYAYYIGNTGDAFAACTFYGKAGSDSRSDLIIFRSSGAKRVYLVAEDVAGNTSTPVYFDATVTLPANFVLSTEYNGPFPGTLVNAFVGGTSIYLPSPSESWSTHFSSRGWSTANDQISAGFPLYFEPGSTTGSYQDVHDCGKQIANGTISVSYTQVVLSGSLGVSVQIDWSADNSTWVSGSAGATDANATNFRYVRVTYSVSGSGGDDLIRLDQVHVVVKSEEKSEFAAITLNASDTNGTAYTTTKGFLDVVSAVFAPSNPSLGTASGIAKWNVYIDDSAAPATPAKVYVMAWDSSNNRVSGSGTLNIGGY